MPQNEFEIVFSKMSEILEDSSNSEFQVTFSESSPAENDAINELRRLSASVVVDAESFLTA